MLKEALLVIDMLNDFVLEGSPLEVPDTRIVLPVIKREIQKTRKEGRPVLYVCDAHAQDDTEFTRFGWPAHAVKGSEGAQVVKEISPLKHDIVIEKTTYSSFYRTGLEKTLHQLGIDSVRLTGCVTHICILSAAHDAVLRGFRVTVVEDGVAGLEKEDHDAALRIMKNVLGVNMV